PRSATAAELPRLVARTTMSGAREEVLRRIRSALTDVPDAETTADVAVQRAYRHEANGSTGQLVDQLVQTLSDYRASVRRIAVADISREVTEICRTAGLRRLVVSADPPRRWR